MDWVTEERILAPKLYTSQNPSTSVKHARYLHDDSDNVKKRKAQGISKIQKFGASCDSLNNVRTVSSQGAKEDNTNRVHWEPPCERSTHQE